MTLILKTASQKCEYTGAYRSIPKLRAESNTRVVECEREHLKDLLVLSLESVVKLITGHFFLTNFI